MQRLQIKNTIFTKPKTMKQFAKVVVNDPFGKSEDEYTAKECLEAAEWLINAAKELNGDAAM